jgi:hypothetical protein
MKIWTYRLGEATAKENITGTVIRSYEIAESVTLSRK